MNPRVILLRLSLVVLMLACTPEREETLIRVIVDSDLKVGSELTRLDVRIFDSAGKVQQRMQSFALSRESGHAARFTLPMSFRLSPESQSSSYDFRIAVTGVGPLGEGGGEIDVTEQQAIVSFRPRTTLRLDMFLSRSCLFELCDVEGSRGDQTCDVQNGSCVGVPRRENLPVTADDGLSDYHQERSEAGLPPFSEDTGVDAGACAGGSRIGANGRCIDIDECEANGGGCDPLYSVCQNNVGSEAVCVDIDECEENPSRCGRGGTCSNVGNGRGYSCSGCGAGFASSGGTLPACVNLNECSDPGLCSHGGTCVDTEPGYQCSSCEIGAMSSGGQFPSCVDVDECAGNNVCSGMRGTVPFNYSCLNADPYYTCRGQFFDWPGADPVSRFDVTAGVVGDRKTGLEWQQTLNLDNTYEWDEAKVYCTGLTLAGGRWRLPKVAELVSLADFAMSSPAVWSEPFPQTPFTWTWTASPFASADPPRKAWAVAFGDGHWFPIETTTAAFVRCVR